MKALVASATGVAAGSVQITTNNSIQLGVPVPEPAGLNMYAVPFSVTFRLDELDGFTEMTNLFDQFKIVYGKLKLSYCQTSGTNNTIPIPFVEYVTDHDDNFPPILTQWRQKMGVRVKHSNTVTSSSILKCYPRVATKVVGTGALTANAVSAPTWVNTLFPETEHYSIKGVIRNWNLPTVTQASPIAMDVEMGVALKDVQ